MTAAEHAITSSFHDSVVGDRGLLHPNLCALPNNELLVTSYGRMCITVEPELGSVAVQHQFDSELISGLRSPAATTTQPPLCSAATSVVWTEVWRLGETAAMRLETAGPVNCVAFSPAGDLIATGLGYYPLGPGEPRAAINLFATADPTQPFVSRVLLGCVVDRVAFDHDGSLLVAVVGAESQNRGHVFLLGSPTLDLHDVAEIDACYCHAIFVDADQGCVLLVYSDRIQIRRFDEFQEIDWEWRMDDCAGATFDAERSLIILSSGQVVSPHVGEVARLSSLPGCTGVTMLGRNRVAGISENGILRVWDLQTRETA